MAENPHNEVHNEPHHYVFLLIMNALSRFSAIMNPQNLILIVTNKANYEVLVFQCRLRAAKDQARERSGEALSVASAVSGVSLGVSLRPIEEILTLNRTRTRTRTLTLTLTLTRTR